MHHSERWPIQESEQLALGSDFDVLGVDFHQVEHVREELTLGARVSLVDTFENQDASFHSALPPTGAQPTNNNKLKFFLKTQAFNHQLLTVIYTIFKLYRSESFRWE
jgi:hypothetical protein